MAIITKTVTVSVSQIGQTAFSWEVRGEGDCWRTSSTHGEYGCFASHAAALADAMQHVQAVMAGEEN